MENLKSLAIILLIVVSVILFLASLQISFAFAAVTLSVRLGAFLLVFVCTLFGLDEIVMNDKTA
jgi:hypothetical protein